MKFKKLLPILFAVGMLVGCGPTSGGGQSWKETDDGKHTITINNKEEMEADWMMGDPTRTIDLSITENGEAKAAIAEALAGNLTFTIKDTKVVQNTQLTFSAVGEGETTVAIKYGGTQKLFNVKVLHKPTNHELYGTTHEGTEDDPFDNEDALLVSHALADKDALPTTEEYYFKGTVESFYHEPGIGNKGNKKVCSWFYSPAQAGGERFEAYLVDIYEGSTQREWTADDIWLGATATVKAKIAKPYNGQHETAGAVFVSATGDKPQPVEDKEATVAEAVADGSKLPHSGTSQGKYIITGYVVKKDDNTYYMADTQTVADDVDVKTLFCLYKVPSDKEAGLLKGAKVKVTTKIKNYSGQVEDNGAIEKIEVLQAGEPWATETAEKITVAQALAKAKAVAVPSKEDFGSKNNKSVNVDDKTYEITGIVTEKGTWSSQYSNADFWIGDTAETAKADALQVFRVNDQTLFDSLVAGTTQVKVTSKLVAFFKLVNDVPTFSAVETKENPTCEVVSGGDTPVAPTVITVAQALALIKAVPAPAASEFGSKNNKSVNVDDKTYEITGYVTAKGTWNSQYSNADFWIGDTAETAKADSLQVFRINSEELLNSLTVGTTQVKVTCSLVAFFKLNNGEVTLNACETNQNPTVVVLA